MLRKINKRLRDIFTKPSNATAVGASWQKRVMTSSLVYSLETPQIHLLKLDSINRFSGFVFDYKSKPIDRLNVYFDNKKIGSYKVDGLSNDISEHVPHIVSARNCRFDFELHVDGIASSNYRFEVVYDDESRDLLFEYSVAEVLLSRSWLRKMNRRLVHIAAPTADLVYLTQGIRDATAYQNSIIPGIYNMKRYLANAGVKINRLRSILDFGCGTGRVLIGWHLDNPRRRLFGCDISGDLLDWARNALPKPIHWIQSALNPPLPYPSNSFDLIYLVSVFTHLSSASQDVWKSELKRIIRPGGYILMTLHGEVYVHLFHPQRLEEFSKKGYIETANSD